MILEVISRMGEEEREREVDNIASVTKKKKSCDVHDQLAPPQQQCQEFED